MCDDGPCQDYPLSEAGFLGKGVAKTEDVRATKPHEVTLTLLVQAEDAGKAASQITDAYYGTGVSITKLAVKSSEGEMW